MEGIVDHVLLTVLRGTESATLGKVCRTWEERVSYCNQQGLVIHSLSAISAARLRHDCCQPSFL